MDKTFFIKLLVGALVIGAIVVLVKYRSFNLSQVIRDNLEANANYYPNITKESLREGS